MFKSKRSRGDGAELEIVYEVKWKTPGKDDDKARIIGILDSPDTNLDWNTFKSYLIQNSGNMHLSTDDIKISYIDSDDDLIPVDSEMEFRECLKFSRVRARHGRKVVMKVSIGPNGGARPKEYKIPEEQLTKQTKLFCLKKKDISEKKTYLHSPEKDMINDTCNCDTPKWFENYMTKFKADLVKEISESVVLNVKASLGVSGHIGGNTRRSVINEPSSKYHLHHMFEKRKKKKKISEEDSSDCTEGIQQWEGKVDFLRHMQKLSKREKKFEKKLDAKLEKLESKTKKIMEKKSNYLSTDSCKNSQDLKRKTLFTANVASAPDIEPIMDALPVDEYSYSPHVLKGEIITQVWNVINNGHLPWSEETELRFAWGSKSLVPLTTSVKCPFLQPGDTGKVKVQLQAPMFAGSFESYWHFHHGGRRFGHWLGCSVIVDDEQFTECIIQEPTVQQESYAPNNTPVDLTMKCTRINTSVIDNPNKTLEKNSTDQQNDSICDSKQLTQVTLNSWTNLSLQNQVCVPVADLLNIKESSEGDKEQKIENVTQGVANLTIYGVPDEWKHSEIPINLDENRDTDIQDKQAEYCSDSDNISVISGTVSVDTDETEPSEEFVVIPMPQCFNCEQELYETKPVTQPITVEIPKSSSASSVNVLESDNNNNMELKPYPEIPIFLPILMTPNEPNQVEACDEAKANEEPKTPKLADPEPVTDDEDPNNVYVKDSLGRSIPVAKVLLNRQQQPIGNYSWNCSVSHNTFGDPTVGHGPNGPRFPCGAKYYYDTNVPQCHNPGASTNFRPQHDCPKVPTAPPREKFCGHPCNSETNPFKKTPECHCPNFPYFPPDFQNFKHEHNCTFNPKTFHNTRDSPQKTASFKNASQQTQSSSSSSSNSSWSHSHQNIHTEQPRSCKYSYVFEKEPRKQSSSSSTCSRHSTVSEESRESPVAAAVQILPETLVTGAVNVASSAINTARSVIDMLIPRHDDVVTGHWDHVPAAVEDSIRKLAEMGFNNRELNIMLLKRHDNDVARVISELIQ